MSKIFEAVRQAQEQTESEDLVRTVLLGLEDPPQHEAPEGAETRLPIEAAAVAPADFRRAGAPDLTDQHQLFPTYVVDAQDALTGVLSTLSDPVQDYVESTETSDQLLVCAPA